MYGTEVNQQRPSENISVPVDICATPVPASRRMCYGDHSRALVAGTARRRLLDLLFQLLFRVVRNILYFSESG